MCLVSTYKQHKVPVSIFYSTEILTLRIFILGGPHDGEIEELTSMIDILDSVCLSSNEESRVWKGDSLGTFSTKSFLVCLSSSSQYPIFLIANFLWKIKVPQKVRAFIWTMELGKINTNNMLQKSRKLTLHVCALLC